MHCLIKSITNEGLIKMCNEIYEWKNTGVLNQEGLFKNIYDKNEEDFSSIRTLEDEVITEAHNRFKDVVKLLFTTNPSLYIKK